MDLTKLSILLTSRGFKRLPHGMKTEKIWRRDKTLVASKRRRFPMNQTFVLIQGSRQSDGTYILGTDDERLKAALLKL